MFGATWHFFYFYICNTADVFLFNLHVCCLLVMCVLSYLSDYGANDCKNAGWQCRTNYWLVLFSSGIGRSVILKVVSIL